MKPDRHSPATLCVHGGEDRPKPYDTITVPIACTSTYVFSNTDELKDHFEGRIEREEYGRYGNPTVRAAEKKLASLDGAQDCVLFSSGMAAVTSTLFAMLRSGQHIVMTSDCYRRTRQFVRDVLSRFGVEATLVEPGNYEGIEAAIVPGKTRLLISESPTNPYLRVADLKKLVALRNKHRGVKVLIDSTFATPINQRPIDMGVDLVVHSGTKYLGGHNDLLAGAVTGSQALVSALRDFRGVVGSVLDPHAAYLLLRGLKTLDLRVRQHNANALALARWLETHPKVKEVFYPGLESHPDHTVAKEQMSGFGGVVSFALHGSLDDISRFVDACRIPSIGPSLGGAETLIEQPSLMSFYELTPEARQAIGIRDDLVRLSVGLEDLEDLRADLAQALDRL